MRRRLTPHAITVVTVPRLLPLMTADVLRTYPRVDLWAFWERTRSVRKVARHPAYRAACRVFADRIFDVVTMNYNPL